MPKTTTNQPLISHYYCCSWSVSFSQNIGWDLLPLNILTTPDVMTVHHYSLHSRPVIVQFSQQREVGGEGWQTQTGKVVRTDIGPTEGVLAAWGARHYWSRSRIGAGEGEEAASLTPPPPSVNRRLTYANGVMHSRVDISWAVVVLGACLNMLFFFGVH